MIVSWTAAPVIFFLSDTFPLIKILTHFHLYIVLHDIWYRYIFPNLYLLHQCLALKSLALLTSHRSNSAKLCGHLTACTVVCLQGQTFYVIWSFHHVKSFAYVSIYLWRRSNQTKSPLLIFNRIHNLPAITFASFEQVITEWTGHE